MDSSSPTSSLAWKSIKLEYEGFPLYLRHPVGLDFESLRNHFPMRMTLTHEFSFRRLDGSPETAYNDTLEEFDLSVTRLFSLNRSGQIVLVETFGGKRHYYFYVTSSFDHAALLNDVRTRYPGYKLSMTSSSDPEWSFIKQYTKDYLSET